VISWQAARELALLLPDTEEQDHFGSPSFRVGGKIFAQLSAAAEPRGRALVKLTMADQTALTLMDPKSFAPEPQWGRHGWTRIELASVEPSTLQRLLQQSRQLVAPPARSSRKRQS
jgi:predicted DNA-binding protein (MmcQ/YjbR family)